MSGTSWIALGTHGTRVKQFAAPTGTVTDTEGRIYVAESENSRIVKVYDMTGAKWATCGTKGSGPHQFGEPRGIFVR